MTIRQNLIVRQGQTFSHVHTHTSGGSAVDLTGYTARMAVRKRFGGARWAYLSTGADADGGTITLGGGAGTITIAMTATETDALATGVDLAGLKAGIVVKWIEQFVYDLEIVSGETVTRVLEGVIEFHHGVTG